MYLSRSANYICLKVQNIFVSNFKMYLPTLYFSQCAKWIEMKAHFLVQQRYVQQKLTILENNLKNEGKLKTEEVLEIEGDLKIKTT